MPQFVIAGVGENVASVVGSLTGAFIAWQAVQANKHARAAEKVGDENANKLELQAADIEKTKQVVVEVMAPQLEAVDRSVNNRNEGDPTLRETAEQTHISVEDTKEGVQRLEDQGAVDRAAVVKLEVQGAADRKVVVDLQETVEEKKE